jgi:hypothetical protein
MKHNIHYGVPICLKGHTGDMLQNEYFWRNGRCKNANTEAWEQLIMHKTYDGNVVIQSR